VIVVFGDDQLEAFNFNNYPSFAIFVGDKFDGPQPSPSGGRRGRDWPSIEFPPGPIPGHPDLAVSILTGVMHRGFDPAFCMDLPNPERGVGHAFMRPAQELTDMQTPIVPIAMNLYFAPQPTATRCYQLGKAVREVIDEYPGDVRVAVVGSGGLWHTPGRPAAWVDENFDRKNLDLLTRGDARGMAEHFDSYRIPEGDTSQDISQRARGITGMPPLAFGPQGGTRETCSWIAAAGTIEGHSHPIDDYIPVYASPVDNAFAYCDDLA
jgi:hypothetical protein